ncbi:MAG: hypothetical protein IAE80_24055 [Anaerolinea sp.]|nr:hypothetical protein [Anaerolinea sp.]
MRIPLEAIIASEKLTRYLLVFRVEDDKSKFLANIGYTLENPDALEAALRRHIAAFDAEAQKTNAYGTFYEVRGQLEGTNERILDIISIWLHEAATGDFRFITLKGWRRTEPDDQT